MLFVLVGIMEENIIYNERVKIIIAFLFFFIYLLVLPLYLLSVIESK